MHNFNIARQQESELPAIVHIQFINQTADYQQGTQQAIRMAVKTQQKTLVAAPIVFDDKMARNIVEKLMYNVWVERDRFTFSLPRKYAYLEPTDVIVLQEKLDETHVRNYVVRIVKMTESRNGVIEVEAVTDYAPVYHQNVSAAPTYVDTQGFPVTSNTVAVAFDIPALRQGDVSAGFYVAMCGTTDVWAGGALYQSLDGGANYNPLATVSNASTIGTMVDALPDHDMIDVDGNFVGSVTVKVYGKKMLSSASSTAVANGANTAIIKSPRGWEFIQFRKATLVGEDTYQLSEIYRGSNFTTYAMAGHAAGDTFVLLDANSLYRVALPNSSIGTTLDYKVFTLGESVGAGTAFSFASTGEAVKYNSDATISGRQRDGYVEFDLYVTSDSSNYDPYVPTTAINQRIYEVEIWDSTFSTLKRTLTGPSNAGGFSKQEWIFSYLTDDQVADFGAAQTTLYARVHGISPLGGRNHSLDFTIVVGGNDGVGVPNPNSPDVAGPGVTVITTSNTSSAPTGLAWYQIAKLAYPGGPPPNFRPTTPWLGGSGSIIYDAEGALTDPAVGLPAYLRGKRITNIVPSTEFGGCSVVTCPGHGFAMGDIVKISMVEGIKRVYIPPPADIVRIQRQYLAFDGLDWMIYGVTQDTFMISFDLTQPGTYSVLPYDGMYTPYVSGGLASLSTITPFDIVNVGVPVVRSLTTEYQDEGSDVPDSAPYPSKFFINTSTVYTVPNHTFKVGDLVGICADPISFTSEIYVSVNPLVTVTYQAFKIAPAWYCQVTASSLGARPYYESMIMSVNGDDITLFYSEADTTGGELLAKLKTAIVAGNSNVRQTMTLSRSMIWDGETIAPADYT